MRPDEMLVRIAAPILESNERGTFLKLGLRQAQAISVVNAAVVVALAADGITVERARIALGAVAPTIVRAGEAEAYLAGRVLDDEAIAQAAVLAAAAARPISDVRGSADYRRDMARVLVARALNQLRNGTECADWPAQPVLLWGGKDHPGLNSEAGADEGAKSAKDAQRDEHEDHGAVRLNVNGREMALRGVRGKTLLRALREDAGLTGTKEGCAEGECGACTVWLDGVAVMSCLVPVERAAGCEVTTVEGLADGERLHPLQQAFVEAGAVQCGYCTPGLLMSAANLLGEVAAPTTAQVREALTGNLCRCTGYYRIVEAVERAAQARQPA
jgi:carbon-monoxide dehydrogenase medium subunit